MDRNIKISVDLAKEIMKGDNEHLKEAVMDKFSDEELGIIPIYEEVAMTVKGYTIHSNGEIVRIRKDSFANIKFPDKSDCIRMLALSKLRILAASDKYNRLSNEDMFNYTLGGDPKRNVSFYTIWPDFTDNKLVELTTSFSDINTIKENLLKAFPFRNQQIANEFLKNHKHLLMEYYTGKNNEII